jgi:MscS family membrane protein
MDSGMPGAAPVNSTPVGETATAIRGTRFAGFREMIDRKHVMARRRLACFVAAFAVLPALGAHAQAPAAGAPPAAAPVPYDRLDRITPRGTVSGFLAAARRDENDLALQYLNARQTGDDGAELARQLFIVLDRRMQGLPQLSDAPEGSRANPETPGLEIVGTITSASGPIDIALEQQPRADGVPIWLFSRATLRAIPAVYQEIMLVRRTRGMPSWLTSFRVGGILLLEWAIMLTGLALMYPATLLLNRMLTGLVRRIRRHEFERSTFASRGVVPAPTRLLLLAITCWALLYALPFSLLSRQFWLTPAALVAIVSTAWLLVLINGEIERSILRRVPAANAGAASSLARLMRRVFDLVIVFAALMAMLRHFGIDPTPALAGLGVGGIAVALAAQKTLENMIAGASLIFDQAVRVGDYLRMGETSGTVEYIGLRSTRIRTSERTLVSIPNSQIANTAIETISARDMYWFHPIVSLRHETTSDQVQAVVDGIQALLSKQDAIDPATLRVRFLRFGAFSLDVEVNAYIYARDWAHFLELQEQLLFNLTKIVEQAGTSMALPSQTMYIAGKQAAEPGVNVAD